MLGLDARTVCMRTPMEWILRSRSRLHQARKLLPRKSMYDLVSSTIMRFCPPLRRPRRAYAHCVMEFCSHPRHNRLQSHCACRDAYEYEGRRRAFALQSNACCTGPQTQCI
jgi:hypothetical protein